VSEWIAGTHTVKSRDCQVTKGPRHRSVRPLPCNASDLTESGHGAGRTNDGQSHYWNDGVNFLKPLAIAGLVATITLTGLVATASTTDSGRVRAVITFVGDSNETLTATSIALTLGNGDAPFATVFLSRPGATIRTGDCNQGATCPTHDFWRERIFDARAKINSDGYVVDLGINDAAEPGTADTPGYASYGQKIDWLMPLFHGRPVWWTNLPCSIEPRERLKGCEVVNDALALAGRRWKNLTVLEWSSVAAGHPQFLMTGNDSLHLSPIGQGVWAMLVKKGVDQRF
jgi:hypothetical protein